MFPGNDTDVKKGNAVTEWVDGEALLVYACKPSPAGSRDSVCTLTDCVEWSGILELHTVSTDGRATVADNMTTEALRGLLAQHAYSANSGKQIYAVNAHPLNMLLAWKDGKRQVLPKFDDYASFVFGMDRGVSMLVSDRRFLGPKAMASALGKRADGLQEALKVLLEVACAE